jgi:hypothetical protein
LRNSPPQSMESVSFSTMKLSSRVLKSLPNI